MKLLTVGELRKILKGVPNKTTIMYPLSQSSKGDKKIPKIPIYHYIVGASHDEDAGEIFLEVDYENY